MSDLIKREDAISAVTIAVLSDKDEIEALKWVKAVRVSGELISRADAIEAVRKELVCDGRHETHDKTCRFIADVLLSALPSAEAVQGEWIKTVNGNSWNTWWVFKCPICGATIEDKQRRSWEYNFCPNCGAKMMTKGGEQNDD